MNVMIPRTVLLFVVLVAFLGGRGMGATEVKSTQASLNDGYSLFYQFCEQEFQFSRSQRLAEKIVNRL